MITIPPKKVKLKFKVGKHIISYKLVIMNSQIQFVCLICKYHHSLLVKKIMKQRVKMKCCVLLNQRDRSKVPKECLKNIIKTL